MLDDGGVDQPALHLPQVRGDDVDVELGKLKCKTEIMHCTNGGAELGLLENALKKLP